MIIPVVQIGNSKGIRLPKVFLNKFLIKDRIDMNVTDEGILLKPIESSPRKNWKEAFTQMHTSHEDKLYEIPDSEAFEWEW